MSQRVKTPSEFSTVFAANFNARDLEGLTSNYTTDATMDLGGGNVLHGRAQIKQALVNFLAPGLPITTRQTRTVVSDTIAYVSMEFSIKGNGPDSKPVTIGGTAIDILKRESDGIWRQTIDLPFGAATA